MDIIICKRIFFIFLIVPFFIFTSCSTDGSRILNEEAEIDSEQMSEEGLEEMVDENMNASPEGTSDSGDTDDSPECNDLIWSDEFDGDVLDETKWSYQRGGWNGSNVQNCYVDENTSVSDGSLIITAKYEPGFDCFNATTDFTSGFIQTKDRIDWTYGYFEARVKLPASNSTWPAFWMSPQDAIYGTWPRSGEIDIFEVKGHDITKSFGNAHWGISASDKRQEKGTFEIEDVTQWHLYAVEWIEGELNFYIDDVWYHTINDFRAPNATVHPGPFNIGYYLRLNMAVGGDFLDEPHNDANHNLNQLPATMEVDYVRVYNKKPDC